MSDTQSNIVFDPDEWSFGDLETFEELTGLTLEEAFRATPVRDANGDVEKDNRGRPVKGLRLGAKTMLAIVFIAKRQEDPEFTLEDARKVKFGELVMAGGDEAPEDDSAASND